MVSEPSTVKPENSIVWQVVPRTEQSGTSGVSVVVVVVSVDGAGDVEIVSAVDVVEESDDVVTASADVVVAYAVVKIFESTNETTSRATAVAIGVTRPIMLVVVPASDESLDDASVAGGNSMMVSVAGAVSVGAVQSLVDAFAISSAAACKVLTDGSLDDASPVDWSVVSEVVDADDVVAVSSVVGGSMTGSGSGSVGVVVVELDDVPASVDDELVSVVAGTVVDGDVGTGTTPVSPSGVGAIADAASCTDAEFCVVNAPAGARYERSWVSALSG